MVETMEQIFIVMVFIVIFANTLIIPIWFNRIIKNGLKKLNQTSHKRFKQIFIIIAGGLILGIWLIGISFAFEILILQPSGFIVWFIMMIMMIVYSKIYPETGLSIMGLRNNQ